MNAEISLIGIGQTRFGEHWDKGVRDLMQEAIDAAIENAGCTALDIDLVIVSNMLAEACNQQAHLGALASGLFPHRPPALRVEAACGSGGVALHTATGMLESGRAETVLVVGVEKMTDVDNGTIASALMGAGDSEHDAPSGLTFPGVFGLITQRYMHEHGLTREELNYVSAHHHCHATKNPFAQFRRPIEPEQVSKSPLVADPLHMLDCSPISDGAAAVVLSTKYQSDVRLRASQLSTDTVSLTKRSTITSFAATQTAAHNAFVEAGIERETIDHLEVHDCFSIAAIISLEDLGYAEPGQGVDSFRIPHAARTINSSGGLKACGHPVGATGVKQMCDIRKQLQTSGSRYGLTQNFGGAGATCAIHILEHNA